MADLQIDPECHTCGAMPGDRHSDACRRGHLIPLGQLWNGVLQKLRDAERLAEAALCEGGPDAT